MPIRRADDTPTTPERRAKVRAWLIARGHPTGRVSAMVMITELDLVDSVVALFNLSRAQYDGGGLG